jgi:hypothetical protein
MSESISPGVLHLFPGQGVLAFIVNGHLKAWAVAWGGPSETQPLIPGQPFPAIPTHPGRYVIWQIAPYKTRRWPFSRIRWGVRLRIDPQNPNDVLYEADHGRWESVQRVANLTRADVEGRYYELYGKSQVPSTWLFNDFGRIAIRYFRDRNHNGQLDPDEHLEGEMFHATAENERDSVKDPEHISMAHSHGCIHLKPVQRDKLIKAGIFARGRILIIHRYDEKYVRKPSDPTAAGAAL